MTTETVRATRTTAAPARTTRDSAAYRTRRSITSVFKHAGLIIISIVMIYPLIWLVVSSFKPNDEIFRNLSIFTTNLTIENYVNGWNDLQFSFGLFLANSTIIS